jgi:chitodextrinase
MRQRRRRGFFALGLLGVGLGLSFSLVGCGLLIGNQAPVAVLEATPARGDAPLKVEFDGSRSHDPDGLIVRYEWDFGDGSGVEGSQAKVSHVYTQNGVYLATLTVIDEFGARDSDKVRIVVGNPPPRAIFMATPTSGWPPLTVQLDASASFDPEGDELTNYTWDFGDGTRGKGLQLVHTFREPGTYAVRLTVTDRDGASSEASLLVRVLGFASARDFRVGRAPTAAVSGDFDGDGQLDLAVAASEAPEVVVLFGTGQDGTLVEGARLAVGRRPVALAAGDFDGDGRLDLAAADLDLGSVWLLFNRGNRSFDPRELRVGRWASALAVADFDRDGALDLAVADMARDEIAVLLGDGAGGFEVVQRVPTGRGPAALAVGDFNGDGRPDLAVAHFHEDSVGVLLGDGVGGLRSGGLYTAGLSPIDLQAADLSGDGRLDLVVANARSPWLTVLLGREDRRGRFEPGERVVLGRGRGAQAVTAGDFDGDGALDLAVADGSGDAVTVLLGDGLGRFPERGARELPVVGNPVALVADDFDRSGFPDLAVVRFDSDSVSLLLNRL